METGILITLVFGHQHFPIIHLLLNHKSVIYNFLNRIFVYSGFDLNQILNPAFASSNSSEISKICYHCNIESNVSELFHCEHQVKLFLMFSRSAYVISFNFY